MFEKEIKFIVDFNLNKIRKSGSLFTLDKLISVGVHPAIVKYISAELDLMMHEDRNRLLNNSAFDYSGSEISGYFNLISREIKRNKRIAFEDIKKLVIQAVSFNVNHVVRPRWSLSKLIFDPGTSRTIEEIKLLLEYPYYYDYVKNIILSYLNKKKLTTVTLTEFENLYTNIDKELFAPGSRKFADNALTSISDFFNEGAAAKDKLPPELVLIFFKEKNLTEFTGRLKQAIPADAKQKYNITEIRSIIFSSVPEEQPPVRKEEITPPKEIEIDDTPPDENIPSSVPEELPPIDNEVDYNFIKVTSKLPLINEEEPEAEIEYPAGFVPEAGVPDITHKSEKEVAEEINLPIVQDVTPVIPMEPEQSVPENSPDEIEIDLDREISLTLPDDEIAELYNDDEPKKIETDEDEIKFDIESKDKLDDLYEFEEDTEDFKDLPVFQDKDFNLKDLESELMQIEEQFNIHPDAAGDKKAKGEHAKKSSAGDIFKLLSNREIERVIGNIFNDDREDFTNTIERISECDSYDKATEILKGVFLTYRINPYSRDAVTLTNAVSKYFDMK